MRYSRKWQRKMGHTISRLAYNSFQWEVQEKRALPEELPPCKLMKFVIVRYRWFQDVLVVKKCAIGQDRLTDQLTIERSDFVGSFDNLANIKKKKKRERPTNSIEPYSHILAIWSPLGPGSRSMQVASLIMFKCLKLLTAYLPRGTAYGRVDGRTKWRVTRVLDRTDKPREVSCEMYEAFSRMRHTLCEREGGGGWLRGGLGEGCCYT